MGEKMQLTNEELKAQLVKIYSTRKKAKLTQQDMADRLGITRQRYARIEQGKAPLSEELYGKILDVLGLETTIENAQTEETVYLPNGFQDTALEESDIVFEKCGYFYVYMQSLCRKNAPFYIVRNYGSLHQLLNGLQKALEENADSAEICMQWIQEASELSYWDVSSWNIDKLLQSFQKGLNQARALSKIILREMGNGAYGRWLSDFVFEILRSNTSLRAERDKLQFLAEELYFELRFCGYIKDSIRDFFKKLMGTYYSYDEGSKLRVEYPFVPEEQQLDTVEQAEAYFKTLTVQDRWSNLHCLFENLTQKFYVVHGTGGVKLEEDSLTLQETEIFSAQHLPSWINKLKRVSGCGRLFDYPVIAVTTIEAPNTKSAAQKAEEVLKKNLCYLRGVWPLHHENILPGEDIVIVLDEHKELKRWTNKVNMPTRGKANYLNPSSLPVSRMNEIQKICGRLTETSRAECFVRQITEKIFAGLDAADVESDEQKKFDILFRVLRDLGKTVGEDDLKSLVYWVMAVRCCNDKLWDYFNEIQWMDLNYGIVSFTDRKIHDELFDSAVNTINLKDFVGAVGRIGDLDINDYSVSLLMPAYRFARETTVTRALNDFRAQLNEIWMMIKLVEDGSLICGNLSALNRKIRRILTCLCAFCLMDEAYDVSDCEELKYMAMLECDKFQWENGKKLVAELYDEEN